MVSSLLVLASGDGCNNSLLVGDVSLVINLGVRVLGAIQHAVLPLLMSKLELALIDGLLELFEVSSIGASQLVSLGLGSEWATLSELSGIVLLEVLAGEEGGLDTLHHGDKGGGDKEGLSHHCSGEFVWFLFKIIISQFASRFK